jgi:hypothetical protein
MAITVTVRDETAAGGVLHEAPLEFPTERITVRELIRERVYQEVQDHNLRAASASQSEPFRGLVQPEAGHARGTPIDWKAQSERAAEAFAAGRILILVDDRQAEALDDEVTLRAGSVVSFLKLTLLVGG